MPRSTKPPAASTASPPDDGAAAAIRVGQRARAERLRLGLTQDEAAAQAGLNLKHLQKLEAGTLNPSLSTLVRLAEGLKVALRDFMDEDAPLHGEALARGAAKVLAEPRPPRRRREQGIGHLLVITRQDISFEGIEPLSILSDADHKEPRQNPSPPPRQRPGERVIAPTPDELMRAIGVNVATLRLSRGLSQQELADRVGISVSTLAQLENGKQNITVTTLAMLAQALKTFPGVLLRSVEGPPPARKPRVRKRRT